VNTVKLLAILVATGCQTYAQHQAALVPHMTPMMTDGQPLAARGQLDLGASNLVDLAQPRAGTVNVGDAVPGTQLHAAAQLRAATDPALSLRLVYENGLVDTAEKVSSSQPSVGRNVPGYGVGAAYSFDLHSGWRLALDAEVLFWNVPWVQYDTCISEGCEGITTVARDSTVVPTLAGGITESYRHGSFIAFGGLTLRNQPTTIEKDETTVPASPYVDNGPLNAVLHAGVAFDLDFIKLSVFVDKELIGDPIDYGTALAAMVAIPLGQPDRRAAP